MKKALFLDRDGIINVDKGYVHKPEDFQFASEIFDVCRYASQQGYLLVVVTNQAGIGRGYYSEQDFQDLTQWMVAEFANNLVNISAVYHCPYHPEHGIGKYRRDSFDRKPNPGMILSAQADLDIDLRTSILLGDKESDIDAAINAGIGCSVLIGAGNQDSETRSNYAFPDLLAFQNWFQSAYCSMDESPLVKMHRRR